MKKRFSAAVLAVLCAAPVPQASAKITFGNDTQEFVYVAHMLSRPPGFLGCSWSGICCADSDCQDFIQQQKGWWGIYPGNWADVWGGAWDSLEEYLWLAESANHVWYGEGRVAVDNFACVPAGSHDRCDPQRTNCPEGERRLQYRKQTQQGTLCPLLTQDIWLHIYTE